MTNGIDHKAVKFTTPLCENENEILREAMQDLPASVLVLNNFELDKRVSGKLLRIARSACKLIKLQLPVCHCKKRIL